MEIQDLNIEFLWAERRGFVLDAPDPFNEKWDGEILKFLDFMKTEPIPKIIELMVIGYKNKYPRSYWSSNFLNLKIIEANIKPDKNGIQFFGEEFMLRNDVISYTTKEKKYQEFFEYDAEIMLEFKDNYNLSVAVEKGLADKTYTKNIVNNLIVYELDNSPIAKLEISTNSFKIYINEQYYEYIV